MTKRYSLCEQVISGDIFDKYPIGIHDKHISKVLRYPELIDILNEQDERIQELEDENEHLIRKRGELETKNIILKGENEELKKENQYWLKTASHFNNISHKDRDYVKRIHKENKELKEKIAKFKEWKKHIGDVKREDLDRVFGMSIYEITEAFRYYEEKIKKLEKELENE